MDAEPQIRRFIADVISPELASDLTPEFQLLDNGVLDSMSIWELIAFVEDTYGVQVEDDDIAAENFETTTTIAQLVASKTAG